MNAPNPLSGLRAMLSHELTRMTTTERAMMDQEVSALSDFADRMGVDLTDPVQCRAALVGATGHSVLMIRHDIPEGAVEADPSLFVEFSGRTQAAVVELWDRAEPSTTIKAGDAVRAWPGTRDGRSYEATALTSVVQFGGTPCIRVQRVDGGTDYIAVTHIDLLEMGAMQ